MRMFGFGQPETVTRRLIATVVIFFVYSHSIHGSITIRATVYLMLLVECVIIWLPNDAVRRWHMVAGVGMSFVPVAVMVFLGVPFAAASQLLWPVAGWVALCQRDKDVVATVLYVTVAIVIVVGFARTVPTYGFVSEFIGLVAMYFGIRAGRLRRLEHDRLVRAHQELEQATLETMKHATMEERMRIARDMHDGVGHQLTSLIVQLQATQFAIANGDQNAKTMTSDALATARSALQELREVVRRFESSDEHLTVSAFEALLRSFQRTSAVECRYDIQRVIDRLPSKVATCLYRVLQESLTNVARHAGASVVEVELCEQNGHANLSVRDDGRLTDVSTLTFGFGLRAMQTRVRDMGGSFALERTGSHGLTLEVRVPVRQQEAST
ncbi:sensor histidine kinase [Alicyclobacillus fastidiosus]|uniref:histidine kinase n=1 Tax=Alicyclobacillus fastidiosus TaxID=392011 RepID=A0ABY6ZNL1_9BACL|nr:sensor histidine kinase [Alicyclobacillus fastidiosus]WAH43761.1 sensor histidine kinase [Alicyclobacillus fastidiosus]GMA59980.1 hypothetical protein GCM10025859_04200 [Alicyclobacillus fastidiosus]